MNLMKFRNLYFTLSLLVIIPGLISLFVWGLRPSIDFTGGSLLEITLPTQVSSEQLQAQIGQLAEISSVQSSGPQQWLLKGKMMTNEQQKQIVQTLSLQYGEVRTIRFETVGPVLGRELLQKALTAAALVALLITLYVARQFSELKYGVSAILAMIHDSLVLLGAFSLLGHFWGVEVDVLFVTALLTTLSFSVHDTIVVYDRIRELRRTHARMPDETLLNAAVLQTLSRSLNNSMTIIIMLLSLVLLGGETIRWFAVALLIGAVTGTYSSTFTAVPLLLLWDQVKAWRERR
jgi:preprotein translocase subunit SecF